jgi:regulator of sigma E protease
MTFLTNVLAFVIALGVIIFVHEAGHLLVAKAFDVRVLAFSLGFGKRLFGFRRGETDYRVSIVPLGGYVRLGGENPDEVSDDPREFLNKPRWQRILVYVAGPAMNVVLAIAIMTALFAIGTSVTMSLDRIEPVIGAVMEGSAGEAAGLAEGDRLVRLEGEPIETYQDFVMGVSLAPEKALALTVERGGEEIDTTLTPAKADPLGYGDAGVLPRILPRVIQVYPESPAAAAGFATGDELLAVDGRPLAGQEDFVRYLEAHPEQAVAVTVRRGGGTVTLTVTPRNEDGVGKIGVGIGYWVRYPLGQALAESVRFNWNVTTQTLAVLGKILTRKVSPKNAVSGPIDIASLSGRALRTGPKELVYLMAIISISIAIFNLLPIPLLDGGQIFILLVETVRGRDLSLTLKERIQQVGFLLIIMLMAAVILMDISKKLPEGLFGGG